MGRKKVKQFSDPGSETASIPVKNPKGVRGEKEAEGVEGKPKVTGGDEGSEVEETEWAE